MCPLHGAIPLEGATHFSVWAPRARSLALRVRTGAAAGDHPLVRDRRGVYTAIVAGVAAGDDYAYIIDGGAERPDPTSRWQPDGVHGPSRVVDPPPSRGRMRRGAASRWRTSSSTSCTSARFTPEGTFDAIVRAARASCARSA